MAWIKRQVVLVPVQENKSLSLKKGKIVVRESPQHLFIVSEEKIGKEDLYLQMGPFSKRKVIATTDPALGVPLVPRSFLKKYILEYNRGESLDVVLVKYDDKISPSATEPQTLKVTSNTIKVKLIGEDV